MPWTCKRKPYKLPLILIQSFESVVMDVVSLLPRGRRGNQYILVICDYVTKYPEAMALQKVDARSMAEQLKQLFSRIGIQREILSDQGTYLLYVVVT